MVPFLILLENFNEIKYKLFEMPAKSSKNSSQCKSVPSTIKAEQCWGNLK